MTTFAEMERRLKRIDVQELTTSSIEETREFMIDQQVKQQYAGLLKDGRAINPLYATVTRIRKISKSAPYDRVTLRDSGEFHKSIFVDVRPNSYVIDSYRMVGKGVLLSPYLEYMYGPSIWGLGGEYKARYIDVLRRAMKEKLENDLSA